MPQTITLGYKELMAEAEAEIVHVTAADAIAMLGREDVVIVDIRDPRELQKEGRIPGSFHAPRGMLEFWVDPESPYHRSIFAEDRTFVIHCASGWRSLLATQVLQRMGLKPVMNLLGGFGAWKEAGGPVEQIAVVCVLKEDDLLGEVGGVMEDVVLAGAKDGDGLGVGGGGDCAQHLAAMLEAERVAELVKNEYASFRVGNGEQRGEHEVDGVELVLGGVGGRRVGHHASVW